MPMSWLGNHHYPSIGCKIGSRNTRLTHENLFLQSLNAVPALACLSGLYLDSLEPIVRRKRLKNFNSTYMKLLKCF
jgi:hypothetical protein